MACPAPFFPTAHPFSQNPCHRSHHLSPPARPFWPSPPSRVVLVRWTPPPQGWYKINFDASVYNDGSGRASIGGAIRDCAGRVVLAFAERTEHSTVGIVEARAMIRGLRLALEMGLQRVVVEGDDLVLAQLLRGEETQTRILVALQKEIVGLLRCFSGSNVRHVYREGNHVAHTLCRQAYHDGPAVWVGGRMPLPPAVYEKVEDDRHGVVHERTVVTRAG